MRSQGIRTRCLVPLAATLATALVLLILPPIASANFVYWTNLFGHSIGRAQINGTGSDDNLIPGIPGPGGIAVDSKSIYWTEKSGSSAAIARANLDATGVNPQFITSGVVNL